MNELNLSWEQIISVVVGYLPKVIFAIIILLLGIWLIKKVVKTVRKIFEVRNLDPSLVPFLSTLISIALYIMLLISVASMLGIATTSFVAVLGAAGLAIGLALQGSLSNFAGGIMILLFKPFRVSDVIEAQGVTAQVVEIQIFHTILKTYDNKTIILPNGSLHNDKIINYSTEPTRVVEWQFTAGMDDDINRAKEILQNVIFTDPRVLNRDEPWIKLSKLGDSSMTFLVRAKANGSDYWNLYYEMNEKVKNAFDKNGITIPYLQYDINVFNKTSK